MSEYLLPINLIIGRNNSGKSTLLDLLDYVTSPKELNQLGHKGNTPKVVLSNLLQEKELKKVFSPNNGSGAIPGNHWEFGKQWVGNHITWELNPRGLEFVRVEPPFGLNNIGDYERNLAQELGNPFSKFVFKRLLADRDIVPEQEREELPAIQANGQWITNTIQSFINKSSLPSSLVEETLLNELNSIFEPDSSFTRIVVQKLPTNLWEIYLEEKEKGRVPLSHTGSGLKTIILVLAFLYLIPHIEKKKLSDYLFGFEELENNLHPALQRRLLLYLREKAIKEGCTFFLTTHSNVAIDLFSNDDKAQILHVTHDGKCASVKRVTTYIDNRGILDDLDVRASDLLQSNGIIWVEGPSDRLYFNRWIELWTDGELKEGAHYQCVFYGGRLLAHLSANDPNVNPDNVVKILRVNRNALLLIDSDRRKKIDHINSTKQRLISEMEEFGGYSWVTAGKEVENYIPTNALSSLYRIQKPVPLTRYQDIASYLNKVKLNEGKKFLRNKVLFAEQVCPHLVKEDLAVRLDLSKHLNEACNLIRKWNGL